MSEEALVLRWPQWLPFGSWSEWLAGVLVAAYLVIFLVAVVRFPYFGPLATVDEQLMYYQVARTFNEQGFLNSAFLQDFSSSSNPTHHPFVYNHMPPGPEILTALLMRAFGERYELIRLVFAAIFVAGIVYYLRFVSLLLGRLGLSGAGLALLLIPPYVMLHTMDHPAYSPFPFVAFFPIVVLDTYYRTRRRRQYWLALLVVVLGSLHLVYQQLLMLFASWALLGVLRVIRLGRREVLALLAAGSLGIVLHLLQSAVLLGPQVFVEELRLTISNRMFGVPTTGELRDFYQSIAVVHQGFHQLDLDMLGDVLRRSLWPIGERRLRNVLIGLMVGALVLALVASIRLLREQRSIQIPWGEVTKALYLLPASALWAAGTIIFPLLVFPAYAASYQLSGGNQFFLAAVAVLGVVYAVRECGRAGRRLVRRERLGSWRWVVSLGVLCLLLLGLGIFGRTLGKAQAREFRARVRQVLGSGMQGELLEIAGPLKGHVVMTNIYPSVVGFFSREAVLGGCELEAFSSDGRLNYLRNDDFEGWDPSSQLPLAWRLSGSGVRVEPDRRDTYRGNASARLVIGTDQVGQLRQWVVLPRQPEAYRLTAAVWVKTGVPRRVRVYVGEASPKFSRFHPGDGTWRLLAAETAMPPSVIAAPSMQLGIQIEAGDSTIVNVDSATLLHDPLRAASPPSASAGEVSPPREAALVAATGHVKPLGVDPSKCHAIWIRGYPSSTAIVPTHYVLFRSLFTGFTMCREMECLDRIEDYIGSRHTIVFQNRLGTVFRLEAPTAPR